MKKIFIAKNRIAYNIPIILTGLIFFGFVMQSCSVDDDHHNGYEGIIDENLLMSSHKTLNEMELDFVLNMTASIGTNVKMIGFKTIHIDEDSRVDFFNFYKDNQVSFDEIENHYYDIKNSCLRIYFPVNLAFVEHNGDLYATSESGDFRIKNLKNLRNVEIIGRKKTDIVRGCGSNIIKGDTILLAKKVKVDHIINDNVLVFDFGERKLSNTSDNHVHDHHVAIRLKSGTTENTPHGENGTGTGTVACINNHGAGENCSLHLNINKGRCSFNAGTCMDYNGIFTNCVNASSGYLRYLNFTESDCDYAMGRGYCFNEVNKLKWV